MRRGRQYPTAWSLDGSTLVYFDDVGIALLQDGANQEFLLPTATNPIPQSFSPDGRFLAYISSESGRPEVYVATIPDPRQGRWQVSTDGGVEALFSPDGKELFYRSPEHMVAVRIELDPTFRPGEKTELFSDPYLREPAAPVFDYDAKGDRFLMIELPEDALVPRIHVVLNWTRELERFAPTDGRSN
jgi:serine/threonine-protein kinase